MNTLRTHEYAACRAAIRERGTVRVLLFWAVIAAWAIFAIVTTVVSGVPATSVFPLLVLAAGFEAIYSLHTGAERLGRFLQVFYEEHDAAENAPAWERAIMTYSQRYPRAAPDPLFGPVFLAAVALNFLPVALAGVLAELAGLGALHLLVVLRVILARRRAARQRAEDLERFRRIASVDLRPAPPAAPTA